MEAEERPVKRRRTSLDRESISPKSSQKMDQPADHDEQSQQKLSQDGSLTSQNPSGDSLENGLPTPIEIAPLAESNVPNTGKPMSKNQQKKLRKKLEWESKRDERKVVRKEKIVAKRERKKAERRQQAAENGDQTPPPKQHRPQKVVQLPVTILIDCDFDELMKDGERISLAAQITRSYSDNKNSAFRAHLTVCSFKGHLRERFDNILSHYKGWRGTRFLDCDFVEAAEKAKGWMLDDSLGGKLDGVFSPLAEEDEAAQTKLKSDGEIVYLTSEAEETLTELKPYSTYIIGGLVDKNREKGICYKRARKRGVRTARLPIGEFMDMQSRKVLATNHVNEIMLKWLECGDWGDAFVKAIPKRKGGKLRGEDGDGDEQDDLGHSEAGAEGDGAVVESADTLPLESNEERTQV